MKFRVSATLAYEVLSPSSILLNIQPFNSEKQTVLKESLQTNPEVKMTEWLATVGEKRFRTIEVPEASNLSFTYTAEVENEIQALPSELLNDVSIPLMPVSVLPYLNPSRYCQSDRLYKFAFHKFGSIEHAFDKVMAICDWIHENVEYSGGHTNAQTSAFDTITEQVGVCRDFAHLGIALCRALTIPARFFTGYAYQLQPPDFHACFEAYLGGYWIIFDATKLVPLNGLVKIATGADAADTAFVSSFGSLHFQSLEVSTMVLDSEFLAVDGSTSSQGYSFS